MELNIKGLVNLSPSLIWNKGSPLPPYFPLPIYDSICGGTSSDPFHIALVDQS